MTSTDDEALARRAVAQYSWDLEEEFEFSDMLGLMNDTLVVTELWDATCADSACTYCHHPEEGKGLIVEAPADWDNLMVQVQLDAMGIVCKSGNKLYCIQGIVDLFSELVVPDITL